jgi:hypothetical protein
VLIDEIVTSDSLLTYPQEAGGWEGMPLLIFSTPELIESRMRQLEVLARHGVIATITINEVDMIERGHGRRVYTGLLPKLRQHCEGAKFLFLSSTITVGGLVSLLPTNWIDQTIPEEKKTSLLINDRALPDCLSFHVERKVNEEQVCCHACCCSYDC